jgi:formylmethanofuran dehydrogenase subunit C
MTRLSLKDEPPVRVSAEGLIPERLSRLSVAEIERLPLAVGNRREHVGDWFRVGAGDEGASLTFEGPCARLDCIGAGMTDGRVVVQDDAGAYLGRGMWGGEISVSRSAGYGAATDMRGGTIRVRGNAGDAVGGSLPGTAAGMRGGAVVIDGNAGAQAGQRLKRGLVVVGGDVGPICGAEMIAGTVVVGGNVGGNPGVAMRRGTIIGVGGASSIGPTFADCGVHDLVIFRLLARHLVALGLATLAARLAPFRRWAGDAAVGGKGEILVPP